MSAEPTSKRTNSQGAPWGGWADPEKPKPGDDQRTRRNRAALAMYLRERNGGPDGIPMPGEDVDP